MITDDIKHQLSGYGKVWNYDDKPVREMFADAQRIEIEEKVDGSQFSMGVIDGQLVMRSKGQQVFEGSNCMFDLGIDTASRLFAEGKLKEGFTYRCEYLRKPKHNTLCYGSAPDNHLVLYDVETPEGESWMHQQVSVIAQHLELPHTPLLYSGPLIPRDEIEAFIDRESFLGGCKIEGVVIKARSLRHLQDGKMLKAKVVAGWFKERNGAEQKAKNPNANNIVEAIGSSLCTEARFAKAAQHIRDRGELKESTQDIGPLLKEAGQDLHIEHADAIKDQLFKHYWPKIQRRANRGLPEWYKGYLRDLCEETPNA